MSPEELLKIKERLERIYGRTQTVDAQWARASISALLADNDRLLAENERLRELTRRMAPACMHLLGGFGTHWYECGLCEQAAEGEDDILRQMASNHEPDCPVGKLLKEMAQ